MTACERAVQVWPLLVLSATRRETLTDEMLGRLIGIPARKLRVILEPIHSYCVLEALAPLTAIVVNQTTGLPGEGFNDASDARRAQEDVYAEDWLRERPPDAKTFLYASEDMIARRFKTSHPRVSRRRKNRV